MAPRGAMLKQHLRDDPMALEADLFEQLRETVRRFVRERLVPNEADVARMDRMPGEIKREMRELGLFGLSIPQEYGGLGLDMEEEVRITFELGHTSPAFRSVFGTNNGIAGLVLYWSLLGLVAGAFLGSLPVPSVVFVALAVIAGVCVMLSELLIHLVTGHRPLLEDGPGTYAIQAFFELFETVIGFLSNSLSYVRVGAFAVAHAGLSAVIFILAELASPARGIGYYIVVIIGNLFIIGFEGLIVGIQTMRLEYYEFFSKFFKGGGGRYEPLTLRAAAED